MKKIVLIALLLLGAFSIPGCDNPLDSGPNHTSDSTGNMSDLQPSFDISPNGEDIVFTGRGEGKQDLYLLHLKSMAVTRVTNSSVYEMHPRFYANGTKILYSACPADFTTPFHIYSCQIDGTDQLQVTHDAKGYDDFPVAIDPTGSKIAFARANLRRGYSLGGEILKNWDIWLVNRSAKTEHRLTSAEYDTIFSLDVNPDRNELLYSGYVPEANICLLKLVPGSSPKQLTSSSSTSMVDVQSTDGIYENNSKTILYINAKPASSTDKGTYYNREIYRLNLSTGVRKRLTALDYIIETLRYSHPSNEIYFLCDPQYDPTHTPYQLWKLNLKTGKAEMVATNSLFTDPMKYH